MVSPRLASMPTAAATVFFKLSCAVASTVSSTTSARSMRSTFPLATWIFSVWLETRFFVATCSCEYRLLFVADPLFIGAMAVAAVFGTMPTAPPVPFGRAPL